MLRLASIMFSIVSTTVMGTGVIAVLSMGYYDWQPILAAVILGAVLSVPITWYVTKMIRENIR